MKWCIGGKLYDVEDCDCDCGEYVDVDSSTLVDHTDDCAFRLDVEAIEDGLLGANIERDGNFYVWGC